MMTALLPLFLALVAFADCGSLRPGQTISLLDAGKSLQNFKMQDQDGLGTCYANTASIVLQSLLPGNPEVSYLDLALKSATHGWRQDWSSGSKYMRPAGKGFQDLTSAGFMCEAIEAAKKSGGVCPKKRSVAENELMNDPYLQEQLLDGLGHYFDYVNVLRNDPLEFEKFKLQLEKAMPKIVSGLDQLKKECLDEQSRPVPLSNAVTSLLSGPVWKNMMEPNECFQKKINAVKKYLTPESEITVERANVMASNATIKMFEEALLKDAELYRELSNLARTSEYDKKQQHALAEKVSPKIATILKNIDPQWFDPCDEDLSEMKLLEQQSSDFIFNVYYNNKYVCGENISNSDVKMFIMSGEDSDSCMSDEAMKHFSRILHPLARVGKSINEDLLKDLLNPVSKYAKQLTDILVPGCNEKGNLIDLSKVSCATYPTCSRWISKDNNVYPFDKDTCYTFDSAKTLYRDKIVGGIREGRALSVSVCRAFLDDSDIKKTEFCTDLPEDYSSFSYHALTVTGYRCTEGSSLEYQLVDSMGASNCPMYSENYKFPHYECILDKDGNPTGKYWVKEDSLVDNSRGVTSITRAP